MKYTQTMSEALADVREGFSKKEIKMAIGVASDPRYKQGNYTGAVNAIEKIKKGLSKHPQVAAVLKRQNEEVELGEDKEIPDMIKHYEDMLKSLERKKKKTPGMGFAKMKIKEIIAKLKKDLDESLELDEMNMTHVLINMQGKVQGYTSNEKDAKEMARRTKSTIHPIKKKISDKTLDKMNALAKTPKELQDLGIIDERAIDPADVDDDATDADKKSAMKNMIMQMRQSLDSKGSKPIEFADGKSQKVDPKILTMLTRAHDKIQKPRDKEKFVTMISKSYRDMLMVAKKIGSLKMGEEVELDEGMRVFRVSSSKLQGNVCLLYTSPSPRDLSTSRMPSSA